VATIDEMDTIQLPRRIPDPGEPVPRVAWPTVGLFAGALLAWIASTALAVSGVWPWPISIVLNAACSYAMFTVAHEAMHHTISTSGALNAWIGRLSMLFFAPTGSFGSFRYIHMQHHLFTNAEDGRDPDHGTSHSSGWTAPLRWITLDLSYWPFYLKRARSRPRRELVELVTTLVLVDTAIVLLIVAGRGWELLLLWYLPIRIAVGVLGWSFDYLPHHGLAADDRFRTTRNRIGAEALLTPVLLYQNYHLVHHLHPRIPFYRYIAAWRRKEDEYLARDPALCDVKGRPLTPFEYQQLRALADHHGRGDA
jgi:ring-1,2-phenylacetyl-CoA epoxidase subunit PaaE